MLDTVLSGENDEGSLSRNQGTSALLVLLISWSVPMETVISPFKYNSVLVFPIVETILLLAYITVTIEIRNHNLVYNKFI